MKSKITEKIKAKQKFKNDNGNKCSYCGCTNKMMLTIDHIIPLVRGGKDINSNKQVCCFICNQLKGALSDEEFKKYMIALEMLYDLTKVKLNITIGKIDFNSFHYPDYQLREVKEKS